MTFLDAPFDEKLTITSIDIKNEVHYEKLLAFDIHEGNTVLKIMKTPLKDFIECIIDDRIICLPKLICENLQVEQVL